MYGSLMIAILAVPDRALRLPSEGGNEMDRVTAGEPQREASPVATLEAPLDEPSRTLALSTDVVRLRKWLEESGMMPGQLPIIEEIEPFTPAG